MDNLFGIKQHAMPMAVAQDLLFPIVCTHEMDLKSWMNCNPHHTVFVYTYMDSVIGWSDGDEASFTTLLEFMDLYNAVTTAPTRLRAHGDGNFTVTQ